MRGRGGTLPPEFLLVVVLWTLRTIAVLRIASRKQGGASTPESQRKSGHLALDFHSQWRGPSPIRASVSQLGSLWHTDFGMVSCRAPSWLDTD